MKSLLLLFLVGFSTAAVIKQSLKWRKSKRVDMIQRGVYSEYLKRLHTLRLTIPGAVPIRVLDYSDYEYVSNITIGTPDQQFVVVPDTGSADLWIPGEKCDTSCDGKQKFVTNSSSTFIKGKKRWVIYYGQGDARGVLGKDVVRFGGTDEEQLVIANCTFGLADHISADFKTDPTDGILGLAFKSIAATKAIPPFLNAIKQGVVDEPIFTVWLARRGPRDGVPGGVFTYGGLDTDNCGPVIAYEPLTSASYFQFKITSIGVGKFRIRKSFQVISDTGTSFIGGPQAEMDKLAKAVGAWYSPEYELYVIPCDANPPTLNIYIGTRKYYIKPENYIIDGGENTCLFTAFPESAGRFGPSWILGDPFIRQYCNIHDMVKKRIGFAESIQH